MLYYYYYYPITFKVRFFMHEDKQFDKNATSGSVNEEVQDECCGGCKDTNENEKDTPSFAPASAGGYGGHSKATADKEIESDYADAINFVKGARFSSHASNFFKTMPDPAYTEGYGGQADDEALKQCEQEVAAWKDKYLRVNADIENMRRRMYKDQEQAVWRAQAEIFTPLLAVMDNFDRAQDEMAKLGTNAEFQAVLNGISLIRKELVALFERFGVQEITQITQFDPGLHEALVSVETPDHTPGDIVQVLQKGYMHKGQVLRVAKVSVAR
jgi:molecular chaperone GrpE